MDYWKELLDPIQIQRMTSKLAAWIDDLMESSSTKELVLCPILKGAVYFATDLSRAMATPHTLFFIEASSYHGQKQQGRVTIKTEIKPERFSNCRVLLVDELYDNGKTLHEVKNELLRQLKGVVSETDITTCVLFRKKKLERKEIFPPPDLVGFNDLPDVWYVGCGLDDNGYYRNLTGLYAVPKAEGIPKNSDDRIFENESFWKSISEKVGKVEKPTHGCLFYDSLGEEDLPRLESPQLNITKVYTEIADFSTVEADVISMETIEKIRGHDTQYLRHDYELQDDH